MDTTTTDTADDRTGQDEPDLTAATIPGIWLEEALPAGLLWFGAAAVLEALALIWPSLWVLAFLAIVLGAVRIGIAYSDDEGDDNEAKQITAAVLGTGTVLALGIKLVTGLVSAVHTGRDAAGQVPIGIITRPIADWLAAHTAGLPITPAAVGIGAAVVATLLWLYAAAFAARGAQLGWVLAGAAAVYMAWAGTPEAAHRPITAGAVAAAWAVLSIPALRRPDRRPSPVAVHHCPTSAARD